MISSNTFILSKNKLYKYFYDKTKHLDIKNKKIHIIQISNKKKTKRNFPDLSLYLTDISEHIPTNIISPISHNDTTMISYLICFFRSFLQIKNNKRKKYLSDETQSYIYNLNNYQINLIIDELKLLVVYGTLKNPLIYISDSFCHNALGYTESRRDLMINFSKKTIENLHYEKHKIKIWEETKKINGGWVFINSKKPTILLTFHGFNHLCMFGHSKLCKIFRDLTSFVLWNVILDEKHLLKKTISDLNQKYSQIENKHKINYLAKNTVINNLNNKNIILSNDINKFKNEISFLSDDIDSYNNNNFKEKIIYLKLTNIKFCNKKCYLIHIISLQHVISLLNNTSILLKEAKKNHNQLQSIISLDNTDDEFSLNDLDVIDNDIYDICTNDYPDVENDDRFIDKAYDKMHYYLSVICKKYDNIRLNNIDITYHHSKLFNNNFKQNGTGTYNNPFINIIGTNYESSLPIKSSYLFILSEDDYINYFDDIRQKFDDQVRTEVLYLFNDIHINKLYYHLNNDLNCKTGYSFILNSDKSSYLYEIPISYIKAYLNAYIYNSMDSVEKNRFMKI